MREIKCKSMSQWLEKAEANVLENKVKPCIQADKLRFGFVVSKYKNKIGYFVGLKAFNEYVVNLRKQKAVMKCFGKNAKTTEKRIERVFEHLRDVKHGMKVGVEN